MAGFSPVFRLSVECRIHDARELADGSETRPVSPRELPFLTLDERQGTVARKLGFPI
jgi:hypothetical protein